MDPDADRRAGREEEDDEDDAPTPVRSFLEQMGQFSTNRLWRQKVGTRYRVSFALTTSYPGRADPSGATRPASKRSVRSAPDHW